MTKKSKFLLIVDNEDNNCCFSVSENLMRVSSFISSLKMDSELLIVVYVILPFILL